MATPQAFHRHLKQCIELQNPLTNSHPLAHAAKLHIELCSATGELRESDPAFLQQLLAEHAGGVYVLVKRN